MSKKICLSYFKSDQHIMKITINNLYMLMGRNLEPVGTLYLVKIYFKLHFYY